MKFLYLHDKEQSLSPSVIDTLKAKYTLIEPLADKLESGDEAYIREFVEELAEDEFLAVAPGLNTQWLGTSNNKEQAMLPLLALKKIPRKPVNLDFDIEPLKIPSYAIGFLPANEIENKEPRYFSSIRALQKYGQYADKQNTGYAGLFKTAQIINKILDDTDPVKPACDKESQLGKYDYLAVDVANDYLFFDHSIETALTKGFKFHLNTKLSESTLKTLAQIINDGLPAALKKTRLLPKQSEQNDSLKLTADQAKQLESINNRLIRLETNVLNEALKIDKEHQKPLFAGLDPVMGNDIFDPPITIEKYEICLEIYVQLKPHDNDLSLKDEHSNDYTIVCEIPAGCSNNKSDFLKRLAHNYNEFATDHPLSGFSHCWLFHQLYAVANISFKDLLRIESIDIDVTVDALPQLIKTNPPKAIA